MQVVVSSNTTTQSIVVKAVLSIHLAKLIADSFTQDIDPDNNLQHTIRDLFKVRDQFRWYCIDQSDVVYTVTFSSVAAPRLLMYQGIAAAVAPADAHPFKLFLAESETLRPGRLNPSRPHRHYVQKAVV